MKAPGTRRLAERMGGFALALALGAAAPHGALAQQQQRQGASPSGGEAAGQGAAGDAEQRGPGAQGGQDTMRDAGSGGRAGSAQTQGSQQQAGDAPDITLLMIEEAAKQPPVDVSAGAIAARPDRYYGKNVRVRAEVEEVMGERLFTLDEDRVLAGPDLLVVGPAGAIARDGNQVRVTGVVRPYVRTQLERDYDWLRLTPEQEVVFKSRPVLVASDVEPADGTGAAEGARE